MLRLVIGCGYLGRRVAERWRAAGDDVLVVTRSAERAQEFEQQGFMPIVADVTRPETLQDLPTADTVLSAVGFDRAAGRSIHEVYVGGLKAVLDALSLNTGRFIYISSTGVYGQTDGGWVDEDSPCQPDREGGRACLEAEQLLARHPLGPRAIILRMAGIYGPGRIPNRDDLVAGRPLRVPEQGFLNLIHVDDAASVVLAAAQAHAPRTYIVSDGHPVERREYYAELARLIHAPPPRFDAPRPSSPAAERASSSKRVSNARMLAELQVQLAYPSFREGLAALVATC